MYESKYSNLSMDNFPLSIEDIFNEIGIGLDSNEDIYMAAENMLNKVKVRVNPCFYFRICNGSLKEKTLTIEGKEFGIGRIIKRQLVNSSQFAIFVATAGIEYQAVYDDEKSKNDPLDIYILDAIGTLIAEKTADIIEITLKDEARTSITNRFSPGYCGWDVVEQRQFFGLLPPKCCGISLSQSALMSPIKSVSGVIGLGNDVIRTEYSCSLCGHKGCYKNKLKVI